tara:strand:- start:1269 stop:1532 length:264 start_codon:yes stop_codon:yes gene_type:complete
MAKKVIKSGKISFSSILGAFVLLCFIGFFASFIYRFVTAENADATKRWCQNCNTYHDITEEVENEIWCENCKTWHAPRDESTAPTIK